MPDTYHIGLGCSFGESNHSVHKHIAEKLNAQLINLSRGGHGNYRILTELIAWINSHSKDINKTTVSIGWSSLYRNDIIENIEKSYRTCGMFKWKVWSANRKDDPVVKAYPKIDIIVDHMIRYRVLITATQNFLENHNIKYVMYNALNNYFDIKNWKKDAVKLKVMEKAINFNKFYKFDDCQARFINKNQYWLDPSPRNSLLNAISWTNDPFFKVKDIHPSQEGNKKWADLVWNFCKENKVF
ncbi:MAG: hypothetical protein H8D84_01285 [Proteobacteria bacterium]|nr:hypothetical protein [Pseudomonadota bacterium]